MKIFIIALLAFSVVACGPSEDKDDRETEAISEAMAALFERVKDPSSVQFQNVRVVIGVHQCVTGEFNAKNGFGAYTGFETFTAKQFSHDSAWVAFVGDQSGNNMCN